jgi:hypothetical protein
MRRRGVTFDSALRKVSIRTLVDNAANGVIVFDYRSITHHGDAVRGVDVDLITGGGENRPEERLVVIAAI